MGIPGFGFGYLGDGRALSLQGLEFIFDDVLASWDPGGARKTFVEPLVCAWCCKVSDDEVTVPAFEKRGGPKAWCRNTERAVVWFYLFPPQEKLRGVNAMHRIQPRLQSQKDLMFETVSTVPF